MNFLKPIALLWRWLWKLSGHHPDPVGSGIRELAQKNAYEEGRFIHQSDAGRLLRIVPNRKVGNDDYYDQQLPHLA